MKARVLFAVLLAMAAAAQAQKQTVCTITVNSPDEREVFRRHLPEDRYDFVELVERGRADWLQSSCRKGVTCDVLLVSGHFAGTEFYSSRFNVDARSSPSTYVIVMYFVPSTSPRSWMRTTFRCVT